MRRVSLISTGVMLVVCGLAAVPMPAVKPADALGLPALMCREPARVVLLDVTTAGNRLVAVGERGVVALSDDGGRTWHQAKVPTSVSLTAVQFPTPKQGWAVGHAGIVLHSEDSGESWTRQLDGTIAARRALEAAQADVAGSTGIKAEVAKRQLAEAQRLVDDGPNKPFLSLYFENEKSGYVVGGYGLIFHTGDGGKTWQAWMDRLDNPKGRHLSAIRVVGRTIYLAGEQGLFFRSTDAGKTFTRIETPYKGSFFTLAAISQTEVVVAGMRGNAYWSNDGGKTFTKADTPVPVSFSAITPLADGRLLFANQAGQILESSDSGRTLQQLAVPRMPPISGMTQVSADGSLVAVGFGGAVRISGLATKRSSHQRATR